MNLAIMAGVSSITPPPPIQYSEPHLSTQFLSENIIRDGNNRFVKWVNTGTSATKDNKPYDGYDLIPSGGPTYNMMVVEVNGRKGLQNLSNTSYCVFANGGSVGVSNISSNYVFRDDQPLVSGHLYKQINNPQPYAHSVIYSGNNKYIRLTKIFYNDDLPAGIASNTIDWCAFESYYGGSTDKRTYLYSNHAQLPVSTIPTIYPHSSGLYDGSLQKGLFDENRTNSKLCTVFEFFTLGKSSYAGARGWTSSPALPPCWNTIHPYVTNKFSTILSL